MSIQPPGAGIARRRTIALAVAAGIALAVGGTVFAPAPAPAAADHYPSWDDVQAAKNDEAATGAEVDRIQGLIAQLGGDVDRTRQAVDQKGHELYAAQQSLADARRRADDLQAQADAEAQKARVSAQAAGRIAAQLARDGGDDVALDLLASGSAASADDLLARLGTMDRVLEHNRTVYADAVTEHDAAQSLSDQADAARDERDRLAQAAQQALAAAQQAATDAKQAVDAQSAHLGPLQAQLAALQDRTAQTVAAYEQGEQARAAAQGPGPDQGGGSDQGGGGGGGLTQGGMTLDQARALMDEYVNRGESVLEALYPGGSGPGDCGSGGVMDKMDNCVGFVTYFMNMYTSFDRYVFANGGEEAVNMAAMLGRATSSEPTVYSVGSDPSTSADGHTFVVLGIQGDEAIIGEAACGLRDGWPRADAVPLSWLRGDTFVDISDLVR